MRCRPRTPGCPKRVRRLLDGELERLCAWIGGILDALDHGRRHRDARHLRIHELERTCTGDEADGRQQRGVPVEPDALALGAERLEMRRLVADLQLQETRARQRLLVRPLRAIGERRRPGVLDSADEQVRRGLDLAAGQVLAPRDRGCGDDGLRSVQVEHPTGLALVAGRDVVAGEAGDVLHAVQRGTDDVGLDREAVLVAADDLHDRLDAAVLQGDGHRHVGGVRMRGRVVRGVDGIHPGRVLLEPRAHGLEAAAVDDGQLPRQHEAVAGQFALELGHAASRRLRASSPRACDGRAC